MTGSAIAGPLEDGVPGVEAQLAKHGRAGPDQQTTAEPRGVVKLSASATPSLHMTADAPLDGHLAVATPGGICATPVATGSNNILSTTNSTSGLVAPDAVDRELGAHPVYAMPTSHEHGSLPPPGQDSMPGYV